MDYLPQNTNESSDNNEDIRKRRKFLMFLLAASLPIHQSGCLFLLARVVLSRGMVRGLARGIRFGGKRYIRTAGRGISMAYRGFRLSQNTQNPIGKMEIVSSGNNKVVALLENKGKTIECKDSNGRILIHSKVIGKNLVHTDFYGQNAGRTYSKEDKKTNTSINTHYANNDEKLGWDIVDYNKGIATHYDEKGKKQGESKLPKSSRGGSVIADKNLQQVIKAFNNTPMMKDKTLRTLNDKRMQTRSNCLENQSPEACRQSKQASRAYVEELMKRGF